MIHFSVTVEGLGEKHGIVYSFPARSVMLAYDPEFFIGTSVDGVIEHLASVLQQKMWEAVYG